MGCEIDTGRNQRKAYCPKKHDGKNFDKGGEGHNSIIFCDAKRERYTYSLYEAQNTDR